MSIKTFSLKRDGEIHLFPNFKVREFRCTCGRCDEIQVDIRVVSALQKIRDHFNSPLIINSAYRCPARNKAVKGAAKSRHMGANNEHKDTVAVDFIVRGVTANEVAIFASTLNIPCIIEYVPNRWVHIDYRSKTPRW
jgi:uncharacterized protein YcbK (DUF882 family)